jgi:selenocysteine lyase/cysteine desulfurase
MKSLTKNRRGLRIDFCIPYGSKSTNQVNQLMTDISRHLLNDSRVRDNFLVLKEVNYLNTGTYGIMPEEALAAFLEILAEFERRGVASDHAFHRKAEEARLRIANLIHAGPEEIAFTRNATDGINLVLAGLDWYPGDEVITTDEEHEAMIHPLMYLHKHRGIVIHRLEVSPDTDTMLSRLDEAVSEKTRLVALSLVSCESGTRLPAEAISYWASERGLLTLFDGAQATGAIPVNVRQIGCDFYASNGHKWLCGPKGTGFFYCQKEKLSVLSPAHVGAGSMERVDIARDIADPYLTGQRFEFGTRAWTVHAGLNASLDWFDTLGWDNIYGHIASLAGYLKARIQAQDFLQLISPTLFEDSSGLTSFVMKGHIAGEVSGKLHQEHKIFTRVVPHYNALRISTAHFNNEADVDCLIQALQLIKMTGQ